MARLIRVSPIDIPQHIIHRGNNRQVCFGNEVVHLLCTPQKEGAISRMMQSVGRMYVRYYNRNYRRSG